MDDGTTKIREKVEEVQKLKCEIRHLQSKVFDAEMNIIKQIIEDRNTWCLRVNYSNLAKQYNTLRFK